MTTSALPPEGDPDAGGGGDDATPNGPTLEPQQQLGHYIDMWKQTVAVQIHFKDIEWRIRGLALTVATFAIGAAGVAAKDQTQVGVASLGSIVLLLGLLLWYAFYFVDRSWYHPLLKAAVEQGTEIEKEIQKSLPYAGMTATITARSVQPASGLQRLILRKSEMHSDDKLKWFYGLGAFALTAAAVALQIGVWAGGSSAAASHPTPTSTSTTR